MADAADLSRRQFLNTAVNAVGAVMTAMIAVPVAGYFIDPALKKAGGGAGWVKLTSVSSLTDTPSQFTISAVRTEGFMKQEVKATVYAFNKDGAPYALSNVCTHLGCPVGWDASNKNFNCPCHGSIFDESGKNIAGPAPTPLPTYATKVENGEIFVQVV